MAEADSVTMLRKIRARRTADRAEAPWLALCVHSSAKNPKPLPVLANVLIGVRAQWPDALGYDEMLPIKAREIPDPGGDNG